MKKTIILFLSACFFLISSIPTLGFTTHNTTISRTFDREEAIAGEAITVTVSFTNIEVNDLRGFYYTEYIPEGLSVNAISVKIAGNNVSSYLVDIGSSGEVYPGFIPYRWVLETPPDFSENNPLSSDLLEIIYTVTSPNIGTFNFNEFSWVGYFLSAAEGERAAFGHSEASDIVAVRFSEGDIDEDGDGMPQAWEEEYGLDLQNNDAGEDPDGDLFTNLQEYLAGTNPIDPNSRPPNHAPSAPTLNFPPANGETDTRSPTLSVSNAIDEDDHALKYSFELYADDSLTTLVAAATDVAAGQNTTNWQVDTILPDNIGYYWRARAFDGIDYSAWMTTANFFVNTANDIPSKPAISSPAQDSEVASRRPTLEVTNAYDADGDALTYEFEVYADSNMEDRTVLKTGVAEGVAGATSWQINFELDDDTHYWWRAQARDNENAASGWTDLAAFFINTANDAPTAPRVSVPSLGEEVTTLFPTLEVVNSFDSDLDELTYFFEIDITQTFDSVDLVQSAEIVEGAGSATAWQPPETVENTTYYWRARAFDGAAYSDWSQGWFMVNLANEPPATVTIKNPGDGSEVSTPAPELQVHPASDPDQDQLTYDYQVYADAELSRAVASIQGAGTSWLVDVSLMDNTTYYWRARAVDDQGASGQWSAAVSFFVNTANDRPEAPALNNPVSGGTVTDLSPTLSVNNSLDRDLDDITYDFELYSDRDLSTQLAWRAEVPQRDWITTWTVHVVLSDNTIYYWRAKANDGELDSSWMPTAMFIVQTTGGKTTASLAAALEISADSQLPQTVEVTEVDNPLVGVQVEVPPGALAADCTITISQVINPPALPADTKAVGKVIELGPSGATFLTELTIRIPYTQADLDAAGITDPAELEVYTYNTSTMIWEKIPLAGVDTSRKYLLCRTDHFSMFTTAKSTSGTADDGGGGGGSVCFIAGAAQSESIGFGSGLLLLMLFCVLMGFLGRSRKKLRTNTR